MPLRVLSICLDTPTMCTYMYRGALGSPVPQTAACIPRMASRTCRTSRTAGELSRVQSGDAPWTRAANTCTRMSNHVTLAVATTTQRPLYARTRNTCKCEYVLPHSK